MKPENIYLYLSIFHFSFGRLCYFHRLKINSQTSHQSSNRSLRFFDLFHFEMRLFYRTAGKSLVQFNSDDSPGRPISTRCPWCLCFISCPLHYPLLHFKISVAIRRRLQFLLPRLHFRQLRRQGHHLQPLQVLGQHLSRHANGIGLHHLVNVSHSHQRDHVR